jgi:aminodeoxyfutalosine synthase
MDAGRRRELEEKVYAGGPLTPVDVEALGGSDELAWLGRLAHDRRLARHGDRVTFVIGGPAPDLGAESAAETLKAFALARLTAAEGDHVTCSLPRHGSALTQLILNFGADDLVAAPDADREELLQLIWDAGLRPVERDAEYRVIREYDPPVPLAERRADPQRVWA